MTGEEQKTPTKGDAITEIDTESKNKSHDLKTKNVL